LPKDAHGCRVKDCTEGNPCPVDNACNPVGGGTSYHVCEPVACAADSDCACGACVNAHCYQGPGQCLAPQAGPP
jgi:hypothetical protein